MNKRALLFTLLAGSIVAAEPLPLAAPRAAEASDWIDLGNEGDTLYASAEITVPKRGQTAALTLTTHLGEERAGVSIDATGRLLAKLHPQTVTGAELKEGAAVSLLIRIVSHKARPDEMFVQVGPAGAIPAEPKDSAWTLIHSKGDSQANLARVTTTAASFKNVRVAKSRAALAAAKPVKTTAAEAPPAADAAPQQPGGDLMLSGAWLPQDPHQLDFQALPKVPGEHAVISDVRAQGSSPAELDHKNGGVNQHNYLAHHDGQFWAMWSDGPGIEDRVGQRVKYATSPDGLKWSTPQFLTPIPPNSGPDSPHYGTRTDKGMRWISRGFWKRDGELLALASLDEAAGFFGPSLELRAFRFNKTASAWEDAGVVFKNTINNFPPLKLRTGDWMMSRRAFDYKSSGVHFIVGGVKSLDAWQSFPVLGSASELKAEEPDWWILPDDRLAAVFRDNRRSGYLYRALSTDDGRTWSKPLKTNFPDATSKISGLRLSDGRYVLVSNPNPKKRDPLTLSISDDGLTFTKMLYLVGGRHIDYPHVIEHNGSLHIAFAGGKQSIEVLKVKLADADAVQMPDQPLIRQP